MGGLSPVHWLIIAVVIVLALGGGRFSNLMGDVAKGIKQFKKGMAEDDDAPAPRPQQRLEVNKPVDPMYDVQAERTREDR